MVWIILLSGALSLILGIGVFRKNTKARLNALFGLMCLIIGLMISVNFVFRFIPTQNVVKWSYAFGIFLAPTTILWVYELDGKRLSKIKVLLLFSPALVFFFLNIYTKLIIKSVDSLTTFGYIGKTGSLFVGYSLYIFACMIWLFFKLYRMQKYSLSPLLRLQARYTLIGIIFYTVSVSITSLILPSLFNIYNFTSLDSICSLFFIGFTTYAILKHHLFNIKVVATEIFAFCISMVLLLNALLSESKSGFFLKFVVFIAGSIAGGLLIKGVLEEIKAKDQIKALADDLSKTNRDLKTANRELKRLDSAKSEFLSIASHQLRTPLTAIKGLSSMLADGDFGEMQAEQKDSVQKIFYSSERLNKLIESLLNISRIESGKLKINFEKRDLEPVIKDVIDELSPVAEQKGLRIIFNVLKDLPQVAVDPQKIRQVILNLVDNSIKYTDKGTVEVNLSLADCGMVKRAVKGSCQRDINKKMLARAHNGNYVVFYVKDRGRGVIKSDQYHLFQKFTRGKGIYVVHTEGTGLGLYVCRKMVEAHHGFIWVESEGAGKGSKFCFALKAV